MMEASGHIALVASLTLLVLLFAVVLFVVLTTAFIRHDKAQPVARATKDAFVEQPEHRRDSLSADDARQTISDNMAGRQKSAIEILAERELTRQDRLRGFRRLWWLWVPVLFFWLVFVQVAVQLRDQDISEGAWLLCAFFLTLATRYLAKKVYLGKE